MICQHVTSSPYSTKPTISPFACVYAYPSGERLQMKERATNVALKPASRQNKKRKLRQLNEGAFRFSLARRVKSFVLKIQRTVCASHFTPSSSQMCARLDLKRGNPEKYGASPGALFFPRGPIRFFTDRSRKPADSRHDASCWLPTTKKEAGTPKRSLAT